MVSADDTEPQINPQPPEGAVEEGSAAPPVETPPAAASPDDAATPASPASEATPESAGSDEQIDAPTADVASEEPGQTTDAPAPAAASEGEVQTGDAPASEDASEGEAPSSDVTPAGEDRQADAPASEDASDGAAPAEGAAQGEGEGAPKRKRRPRGRRQNRGNPRGGRRRFQWDEVFLRQRLEILRAMDPDPKAIAWAINAGGRFDVADILAGEGSSGREFGRRAYAATPETDDQAAWIILSAVRARDIVPIARQAVSGTTDQREQVKAAIEKIGIARINPALQGEKPAQEVFAERARRVDLAAADGEEQKAAWALLSLARPQDVRTASAPPRPRTPPGGRGGPGGPGGPGGRFGDDDRRGRQRRDPGIPGGVFSVGESGIGGELGAKLRAALAAAEAETQDVPETQDAPASAEGDNGQTGEN